MKLVLSEVLINMPDVGSTENTVPSSAITMLDVLWKKFSADCDVPYALIKKSFPAHAARSMSLTRIVPSLKAPPPSALAKDEKGVMTMFESQAVVAAIP